MEAIGIQSQLAGTKVAQLNQAWDAWMSSVTGTMADFSQVQTALAEHGRGRLRFLGQPDRLDRVHLPVRLAG